MLSHKTYQNQGICYVTIVYYYVTKTFVARNKFYHARNTKKVGQAWPTHLTRFTLLLLLRVLGYMRCNHVATWA